MKKIFYPLLAGAMALTSCSKEAAEVLTPQNQPTTFTLAVEQAPTPAAAKSATRTTTTIVPARYIMEVWSEDGATPENVFDNNGTPTHHKEFTGGSITVILDKTKAYTCLFWADDNRTFDASSLKVVSLNKGEEMAEAYCAKVDVAKGKKPTVAVILRRAVAKIMLTETNQVKTSDNLALKFTNMYSQFSVLSGGATGSAAEWTKTVNPAATTGTIATLYFFAKPESELTEFTFTYADESPKTVSNIPYQQNFATSIKGEYSAYGSFSFYVSADDEWELPDNEANMGQSVYIGGYENNEDDIMVAKYWKDGVAVALTDGTRNAYVNSIFIANGNVYAAGCEEDAMTGKSVAKYWINDMNHVVALSDGTAEASASSIFVDGDQVYVAGFEREASNRKIAKYWVGGKAKIVVLSTEYSEATAITISGGKVYVAGYVERTVNMIKNTICTYWTDGVATEVSDPARRGQLYSIAVSGDNVYVCGYEMNEKNQMIAKYWKNNKENGFVLSNPGAYAMGASIFVSGSDVYVAGYDTNSAGKYVAKYWKNNRAGEVVLSPQTGFYSLAAACLSDQGLLSAGICLNPYGGVFWRNGVEEAIPATYVTEFFCVAVE